jgi:hypothetical protein
MPSVYLQSSDYANYGVPNATAQQASQASIIIDGFLQRSEGLIYTVDSNSNPCFMTAKAPSYTLSSVGSVSPGLAVSVTVTGSFANVQVGDWVILDRTNTGLTEGCIVQVAPTLTNNVMVLQSVQRSHMAGTNIDFGLSIFEERKMPTGRPLTTLSRWPIANLVSGRGRYGYGRRGQSNTYLVDEYNLLAAVSNFGGPPYWELFNVSQASVDINTGNIWIPAGVLIAYYTDINVWYVAGYTYQNLPEVIKQACANLINNLVNVPVYGNIKSLKAGDTSIDWFNSSSIDETTKSMLMPYRNRTFI